MRSPTSRTLLPIFDISDKDIPPTHEATNSEWALISNPSGKPGNRKSHNDSRSTNVFVIECDGAFVGRNDGGTDREPEAGTAGLPGPRGVTAREPLEDQRTQRRWDSGPAVGDGDDTRRRWQRRECDSDAPASGRVADRVFEQVVKKAAEQQGITLDDPLAVQLFGQHHAERDRVPFPSSERLLEHISDVDPRDRGDEPPGVAARECEEGFGDLHEASRVLERELHRCG